MAQVALDDVVWDSEVDHARSHGVAELMRLEAEELAVGSADSVVIGETLEAGVRR